MMGKKTKQSPLFYYINIGDMIPENHILRLINKYIDLSFIRKQTKHLYSNTGRPSVDPEVLLRMLLVGYLYGITSERRLCEEVSMHLGYRWFTGLSLDDKVPDHSTFSKNRHNRFKESGIFQDIFDEIVKRCIDKGLVSAKHLSVDGSPVKANASIGSMEPIVIKMNPEEYMDSIEQENKTAAIEEDDNNDNNNKDDKNTGEDKTEEPSYSDYGKLRGEKISNKTHRSKTDPDARLARKTYTQTKLSHLDNYLIDNKNRIIVGVKASIPGKKGEVDSALSMIKEFMFKFKIKPKTLGADKGYSSGEFIHNLLGLGITPHIPIVDSRAANERDIFPIDRFRRDEQNNSYICPDGKILKYHGIHYNQIVYRASMKDCKSCSLKQLCTKDRARSLSVSIYEEYMDKVRKLSKTEAYRTSIKKRKTIESLFGEAKEQMGLRVCKFRRRWNEEEQFLLTAAAQNIKRMVRLFNKDRKDAAENRIDRENQTALPAGNAVFRSLLTCCRIVSVFIRKYAFT